jgi:20S proteasome subunit beta 1
MVVINEEGVERHFIPGNELPRFWEGKEILPTDAPKKSSLQAPVPMEA